LVAATLAFASGAAPPSPRRTPSVYASTPTAIKAATARAIVAGWSRRSEGWVCTIAPDHRGKCSGVKASIARRLNTEG
jgi:hypothetical protein